MLARDEKMNLTVEPHAGLTKREHEIALLIARGLQNKAIARELHLSDGTVKLHVHKILQKLGLKSRLVLMAHGRDLPNPSPRAPNRPSK